ncbi:PAS domain-containing sensor histidine kinase [Bacteroidota bacterium]
MAYSKFYINIIFRIFLILATCFLLAYIIIENFYLYTSIGIIILIGIQVYLLINFFIESHRYLTSFLLQIKESKNVSSLPVINPKTPYAEFNYYFEEISKIIRQAKIEKENQYLYLQYVVEHVGVGLIAFDKKGKVEIINKAAKNLLQLPNLLNVRTLDAIQKGLSDLFVKLQNRETKLTTINIGSELLHISISASEFILLGKDIKLVSLQDIKAELDEKEVESWQKLIRILNHEIMNSITPVTTLTSTISKRLKNNRDVKQKNELDQQVISETVAGLDLIAERGKGLIDFVTKYRNLTSTLKPEFTQVSVKKLFNHVKVLMGGQFESENINLILSTEPDDLSILADNKLIEQVLINLIKNSAEALNETSSKKIILHGFTEKDRTVIKVIDNGTGISHAEMENIFIPFYTTKEKGSGIGLSLSRQIMRVHKGSLKVQSIPGKETTFTMQF